MIVVTITGGLGNQMFQYAFGKALSLERGVEVLYDTSYYKDKIILHDEQKNGINRRLALHHFNVNIKEESTPSYFKWCWRHGVNKIQNWFPYLSKIINKYYVVFNEIYPKGDVKYHPNIWEIKVNNIYFIGFWQSEKYFLKYRDEILHDFQIITPQSKENRVLSEQIMKCNSISLHVRRGDYLPQYRLDKEYYARAIDYISKHIANPVFFIFSDDFEWVKNNINIPFDTHYVELNSQAKAYEDMRLMSQCKCNIIANSTFSWWGAWLNQNSNKIVVAPEGWIPTGNFDDIIPETWIQL